jgi:hypothetical protein
MRPVIALVILGLTVVGLIALVATAHMHHDPPGDDAFARSIARLVERRSVAGLVGTAR